MYRIRLTLPSRNTAAYRCLDILHDALVNSWIEAGANPKQIIGHQAKLWNFAALGWRKANSNRVHSLVVSTPDRTLGQHLAAFDPASIQYARASTEESVDFSAATIVPEDDSISPGGGALGCLMLSPLVLSVPGTKPRRWCRRWNDMDVAAAINQRLSRLSEREVGLKIAPDSLYLRANPKHSVLVPLKRDNNGNLSFVIGLSAPLVLMGSEEDLRLAWYAGIGEKTRSGFGCIGLVERGVGR